LSRDAPDHEMRLVGVFFDDIKLFCRGSEPTSRTLARRPGSCTNRCSHSDIARWKPYLIVLEDYVGNLSKRTAGIRGQMPVDRSLGDPAQILPGPAISGFAQSFAQTAQASQGLISRRSGTLAGGLQSCVCS